MKFASFLASHASRDGAKDAVVCNGRRLSFAELDASTSRVARHLREAGVEVGDRVALYLPNSIEFVQAFLGAIKAGAIVVPLNLPLSAPEIAHMLADAEPKAVFLSTVTQATFAKAAQDLPPILRIGVGDADGELRFHDLSTQGEAIAPEVPAEFDDCLICYTSGTTGRPKGAVLTQANFIFANGYLNGYYWGLNAQDRHLCTTPLAHRTAMARLMNVIVHGSTLVVMERFDAEQTREVVRRERITVFGMVPTVGRLMLQAIQARPADFSTLRVMLVVGEAFPIEVKQQIHAALPHVRFYSFFAQTEAAAIAWLDSSEQFTHPTSVGRPWHGVEVRAVNDQGQTVATGEVGEVWVRSGPPGRYSTMRGYFNRPEATAAALKDGWLATGDVGRFDADGYLYLVDRKKDMVVTGGYNVYSKEVELALLAYPGVADAAVVGVPDATFGESVTAYIEPEAGATLDAAAIVEHCRERLSGYKKPKHVFFVDALPRNSTGKVLKTVLRERAPADVSSSISPTP